MSATSDESAGTTRPAGEGLSDEEMVSQVAGQTSSDLEVESFFERESEGAATDKAAADTDADDLT
jgi:hypothetical protein